jgi:hypothetical protein
MRLNTWIDLRGSPNDPEALQRLIAGVQGKAIDTVARDPRLAGLCPYRGLLPFREEDAGLFFGRRRYVDELVRKVGQRSPPTWSPWWVVPGVASRRSSMLACCLCSAGKKALATMSSGTWSVCARAAIRCTP